MEELRAMLHEALEHYGPLDLITVMLSQRWDKEVAKKQRRLMNDRVG